MCGWEWGLAAKGLTSLAEGEGNGALRCGCCPMAKWFCACTFRFGCCGVGGGGGGFRALLIGLGCEEVDVVDGCEKVNEGVELELSERPWSGER